MISQSINVPLTQRELKSLTVLTSSFIEDVTGIIKNVKQNGGEVNLDFIKASVDMAVLLAKLNGYREGAIGLEIAELDAMFKMPSVNPSVGSSEDDDEGR
jgi:hypothetical protein